MEKIKKNTSDLKTEITWDNLELIKDLEVLTYQQLNIFVSLDPGNDMQENVTTAEDNMSVAPTFDVKLLISLVVAAPSKET